MSRQLPEHPDLEHLHKQAKALLVELQQRDASRRLADAQHELARSYGFASWPKLKVFVAARSRRAPSSPHPLAGRWQANIERSTQHPDNPVRRAIVNFDVVGDIVTIGQVTVDVSGREDQRSDTLCADGREHVAESGYSVVARWQGDRVLEVNAMKDGGLVGWGRYELSPDGRSLTVTADRMRVLFERVA